MRTRKKASPLREGDREAVVGVPISPLLCIVGFALCKDGDVRCSMAWGTVIPCAIRASVW